MVFLNKIIKGLFSSTQHQEYTYTPPRRYTPEEFVILEQERSGERWHGVLLYELSRLAHSTYRGKYVKVDKSNFLVLQYTSKSRKTQQYAQYVINENGKLEMLPHGYYQGQWRDSSDEFLEKANQDFSFKM